VGGLCVAPGIVSSEVFSQLEEYAVRFPSAGPHTLAWVASGTKNAKSTGTRIDLDAFLALMP
jgi:hypothetical protein